MYACDTCAMLSLLRYKLSNDLGRVVISCTVMNVIHIFDGAVLRE